MAERSREDFRHQHLSGNVRSTTGFCTGTPSRWVQTGFSYQSYPESLSVFDHRKRAWDIDEDFVGHLEAGVTLPTNYYRDQRIQAYYPSGAWEEYGRCSASDSWTLRVYGSGNFSAGSAITPDQLTVDGDLMADAKLSVLNQIKDMHINIAVFSAEAPKTVDLLRSSFEKMFTFASALKRGRWRQAYRALYPYSRAKRLFRPVSRQFAQQVLEYKYAWTPLMFDCYGAAKALAEELGGRPPVRSFTKRKRREDSWEVSHGTLQPSMRKLASGGSATTGVRGMPRNFSVESTIERLQVATAGLRVSPICNDVRNYGLNDPLLVAWELVPFSFVFDWFISVGDYLSAATALRGLKVESGWDSHLIFLKGNQIWIPLTDQGWMYDSVKELRRNYTRSPWSGSLPSVVSLVDRDPFGLSRLISAMSLARVRFR